MNYRIENTRQRGSVQNASQLAKRLRQLHGNYTLFVANNYHIVETIAAVIDRPLFRE